VKRFVATSCLLLVALVSAGCNVSSSTSAAARVNASTITVTKLNEMMTALKGDAEFLCLSGAGAKPITTGAGTGTWNEEFAGYVLTQLIKFSLLQQMVAARHLVVPAADLSDAKTEVESAIQGAGQTGCSGTPATAINDAGAVFQTALLDNQLDQDAYSAYLAGTSLDPAALASWGQSHQTITAESCTSVIQVSSNSLARKLETAIRGGVSFAKEADRYNAQNTTGKGGEVGCVLEQQWVGGLGPTVSGLQVGVVSRPVSYQSAWLLFLVTKRVAEPADGLLAILEQHEATSFNQQYGKVLSDAHVTVSPVYGTWKRTRSSAGIALSIVPPSSKACAYALSTASNGCATRTTTAGTAATGTG